jgi:hypothetical protein
VTPRAQYLWLQVAFPAAGLIALLAGVGQELPLLADAGLIFLGAAGIAAGGVTATLRRVVVAWPAPRLVIRTFTGPGAAFSGSAVVILGLAAVLAGLAHLVGTSPAAMKALVVSRPGVALAPAGAALLSNGLAFLIGFPEGRDPNLGPTWNALLSIPARLGGLILLLLGGAALALGAWELLAPEAFDRLVASLRDGGR